MDGLERPIDVINNNTGAVRENTEMLKQLTGQIAKFNAVIMAIGQKAGQAAQVKSLVDTFLSAVVGKKK